MDSDETQKLDAIARRYDPSSPNFEFDYWFVRLGFETISKFMTPRGRVLELGCSTGLMTSLLAEVAGKLVVVEGSSTNIETARQRVPCRANVSFFHSLWEDFECEDKFGDAVLSGALEHVVDPVALLARVGCFLERGGKLHLVVPNARSLHRRIGKYMGLLSDLHDLNESDHRIGHRRVYDRDSLFEDARKAGLKVLHWEGIVLKPLSNAQMRSWSEALVRAFYQAGRELPDYCGEIYACCTVANP